MAEVEQAHPHLGRDMIAQLKRAHPVIATDCVLLCALEPWDQVWEQFPGSPKAVAIPQSMERTRLEALL